MAMGWIPEAFPDKASFCYDEQNRLTWASSQSASGPDVTGPSTPCASNTAGTLTGQGALYTATYAYDNMDRLTGGPAGSAYTYGDSAHLHAATSTSGGYSASYDASGNMVCRAPTNTTTCAGSNPSGWTGQLLTYDNEGQLIAWQNQPGSSPTSTDAFAYDGEGSRVAQSATTNGVTTTTDYLLGGLEEVSGSTLTEYYPLAGIGTAVRVSTGSTSSLSYLMGDGLGSVSVAVDTQGNVTAQQLYSPYGTVRYSSGTMPTAHGYTGQLADATTGLDYYGARYYDPLLGQFAQADSTAAGGLNRYAYVGGNPESATDPSGHRPANPDDPPPEVAENPWIELAWEIAALVGTYFIGSQSSPTATGPISPAPKLEPPPPTMFPAASPGSSQWTLPDKDYRQWAMQTTWAILGALNGAVQQLGSQPTPSSGPQPTPTPTPGAGPTGPSGEPLGSSPDGEQGPEPQPSTEGAGSGVCCGCGCGSGSGGSGGVPPQGYGPAHSAINAAKLRQLAEYVNKIGEPTFLDNGIVVFHGPLTPATRPGPSIGSRYVKAWNPETGATLGWYETILADGTPKVIHLKDIDHFTLPWGPHIVLTNGCLESWW